MKKKATTTPTHQIKDIESGVVKSWSVMDMITEINRERGATWTDYNESDYLDGWNEWIEGLGYYELQS